MGVKRKIALIAKGFDLNPHWMWAIAYVESRIDPKAKNKSTGAAGVFQFVPSTAREYNIDPFDVAEATAAACIMATRNAKALAANGVEPTLTMVYLAHQQGLKGILEIVKCAQGQGVIGPQRIKNMRANCSVALPDTKSDKENCNGFILWWTGRLGMAELEVTKDSGC